MQQIACVYLRDGYEWFVQGQVPESKDPAGVDARIIEKYRIDVSEATRWRRKQLDKANVHYLRFNREFVIMATKGRHRFKELEAGSLIWARETPIRIGNYTISRKRGGRTRQGEKDPQFHSHVQIEWGHYKELKAMFLGLACRRSLPQISQMFYELPFEPYAPVRRQIGSIWRQVNRLRRRAGLPEVPKEVLPLRTKSVRVYEPDCVKRVWSPAGQWWYEVRLNTAA